MSTTHIFPETAALPIDKRFNAIEWAEVIEPFDVYVDSGKTVESNTYIGASQALGTLWERRTLSEGDMIVACPGGTFLVGDGPAARVRMGIRTEHLFCKGSFTPPPWPLTHLEHVDLTRRIGPTLRGVDRLSFDGARALGAVIAENGTDWILDLRG